MDGDFKMLDVVMFALEEKGNNKGAEIPGSMVRLFRLPDNLSARMYGRYSGPWEDFRVGMAPFMTRRTIERTKKKPAYMIVEPSSGEQAMVQVATEDGVKKKMVDVGSVEISSWSVRPEDSNGALIPQPDGKSTRFSPDHAKYFKDLATKHYRHGTMKDLDDETSEAIYMDEVEKGINKLVGKIISWELRPYIKTAHGAASGVDEFRLQLIDGVEGMEDEKPAEVEEGTKEVESKAEVKGFPKAPVK